MLQARYITHPLQFIRPAGTSRGLLLEKACWFLVLTDARGCTGIGEVSFVPGLSLEDPLEMEINLDHICKLIGRGEMDPHQALPSQPGIQFALECALKDLDSGGRRILYPSDFSRGQSGIITNGLIWMGQRESLMEQVSKKMEAGFSVLKMKVGTLNFGEELEVLGWIRKEFGTGDLEIRLDANGAWDAGEAREKMEQLASFGIHSIEQPLAPGQAGAMAELCREGTIPVALDEELIGISSCEERHRLLGEIQAQYIILKPGLLGGISQAEEWIRLAAENNTGWWVTSALESNIGLNAIAQWTAHLGINMPQGLGTGSLFSNNIPSPLKMEGEKLWYREERGWDLTILESE